MKTVLLVFRHGLGDLLMFLPGFDNLVSQHKETEFTIDVEKGMGYEETHPSCVVEPDRSKFDIVMNVDDLQNHEEFKGPFIDTVGPKGRHCPRVGHHQLPKVESPIVGVHFHSTCCNNWIGAPEETARKVWEDIIRAGKIPVETHMVHKYGNWKKFDWEDGIYKARASVKNLSGILQRCFAFVGVVSGNFHVALGCLPYDRIMCLQRGERVEGVSRVNLARCDVMNYKEEVYNWLMKIQQR